MTFPPQQPPSYPGGAMPMYSSTPQPPSGYPPGAPPSGPMSSLPPGYGAPPPHPSPYAAAPPQQYGASPYAYPMQPSFPTPYGHPGAPPTPAPYFQAPPQYAAAQHSAQPQQQFHMPHPPPSSMPYMQHQQQQQPGYPPQPQQVFPYPPQQQQQQQQQHFQQQQQQQFQQHQQQHFQQPHPHQQLQQQHLLGSIPTDAYGLPVIPGDQLESRPLKLRVEETILSATRDSFSVLDASGATRYKVDSFFSLHERKTMKDVHGNTLLKLREARLKLRDKITIFNAANVPLLTLQKASAFQLGTKRVNGYLGGRAAGSPAVVITGNGNNTQFHVMNAQNTEIASITRRKFSLKNMLTDQDTYDVTINYGSPALACFITVAIDEIYED